MDQPDAVDISDENEDQEPTAPEQARFSRHREKHIEMKTSSGVHGQFFPTRFQVYETGREELVGALWINGVCLGTTRLQAMALFYSVESNQDYVRLSLISASGAILNIHGPHNVGMNILNDIHGLFPLLPRVSINVET